MTIFYQHVGGPMVARDFPRSIGTRAEGLQRFNMADVSKCLPHLTDSELGKISQLLASEAPNGFQIWGLPSGAGHVLSAFERGDLLLLLETDHFKYIGRALHRVSELSYDLSSFIWGEARFPIIVFLDGKLIGYPWESFRRDFGFDERYHMRGNTMKLADARLRESPYRTESAFLAEIIDHYCDS